ncbi:c-type cytochrome, partial [Akkermansiaceae bacterium]|nr:c-type cytochrome [Akkermansiaceae bacterium]
MKSFVPSIPKLFRLSAMVGCATITHAVEFENDILPILEENCLDCHGPDKQKSGFRIDQRALMLKGGDTGIATLVPGDWEASYLMEVVTHLDEDMAMPPKGDPLSESD